MSIQLTKNQHTNPQIVLESKELSLVERILQIDKIQGNRFSRLTGGSLQIATEGINRHLKACSKMEVMPDPSAVREIIDDSLKNRRVFAEVV